MKLLHVDSSILGPNSVSRTLSAGIVAQQKALHPGIEVKYLDLAADAPFHLSGAHVAAWHGATPEDEAVKADLAKGVAMLDDVLAADIIVIGAPMYNFAIPSQLKAWIDRLLIAGRSFRYTANGPESLLAKGKKVFIASTRGGFYGKDSPVAAFEHQESYLRIALGFIGLTEITTIQAEGIAIGPEAKEAAISKANSEISALAA